MISVILSIFNEVNNPYFLKVVNKLKDNPFFEPVIIDGGSTDGTLEILKENSLNYFLLENSTRGARLNLGILKAKFDAVLLHHPRSMLEDKAWHFLKENYDSMSWFAFMHQFDHSHKFLKYISWYSNCVRVKKKNVVYLDHCLFFNKALLNGQSIPDLAIFEDTALSELLNKNSQATLLSYISTTSAVRFLERGIYRQFFLNQCLKFAYKLKWDHRWMNRRYEKKLNLNQRN